MGIKKNVKIKRKSYNIKHFKWYAQNRLIRLMDMLDNRTCLLLINKQVDMD